MDSIANLSRTSDLFRLKPNWMDTPKVDFEFYREVIQFVQTSIDIYNLGEGVPSMMSYGYLNVDREDYYYIVDFFVNHQGKLQRFWLPVWKNAFELTADISSGDSIITIRNVYFNLIERGYERIFIELKNGDFITRSIMTVVSDGDDENIFLNTAIGRDISTSDIKYFGRLMLVRFDADELPIDYRSDKVTEIELGFIELPHEYEEVES